MINEIILTVSFFIIVYMLFKVDMIFKSKRPIPSWKTDADYTTDESEAKK